MVRRPLAKRLWYGFVRAVCRLLGVAVFQIRCSGREHVPARGGVLVLSNHQSHFDPVLIGLACDRRLNFLARETLFRFLPFAWLIRSLDAIPFDREGVGISGLKETLRRLKAEEPVLVFPEGTRTRDGEIVTLKPGFCALARRSGVSVLPAGIAGAFDAWPRWRRWPGRACIHLAFGPPLLPAEIQALGDRELVVEVERRIRACHATAQASRRQAVQPLS